MHQGETQIHLNAPPELVYAMVADVKRMGEWSPECYKCAWLDGATEAAVGARFRGYNRANWLRWSRLVEVTSAVPGKEFAFTTLKDFINTDSTTWRYVFQPTGGGTLVTESYTVWAFPSLTIRIISSLARRPHDMRPHMASTLQRLKAAAEHQVATTVDREDPTKSSPLSFSGD
ncbi:MAG: SRPBCC family protein [Dehalococcoidia bacterium]